MKNTTECVLDAIAVDPVDVNVMGDELYMCATDYEHELGNAAGGAGVYASIADLKACRSCVVECGIVAVRVEFVRYVEHGMPYSERGKETPNVELMVGQQTPTPPP